MGINLSTIKSVTAQAPTSRYKNYTATVRAIKYGTGAKCYMRLLSK